MRVCVHACASVHEMYSRHNETFSQTKKAIVLSMTMWVNLVGAVLSKLSQTEDFQRYADTACK